MFYRTLSQHWYQNERKSLVTRRNDTDDDLLITNRVHEKCYLLRIYYICIYLTLLFAKYSKMIVRFIFSQMSRRISIFGSNDCKGILISTHCLTNIISTLKIPDCEINYAVMSVKRYSQILSVLSLSIFLPSLISI